MNINGGHKAQQHSVWQYLQLRGTQPGGPASAHSSACGWRAAQAPTGTRDHGHGQAGKEVEGAVASSGRAVRTKGIVASSSRVVRPHKHICSCSSSIIRCRSSSKHHSPCLSAAPPLVPLPVLAVGTEKPAQHGLQ